MTAPVGPGTLPSVSVVIATRGRSTLRNAVRAALAQTYPAPLDVLVVFDQADFDQLEDVIVPPGRGLRLLTNTRTPGLAGARNSGIIAGEGELIAFCDDDDEWRPEKIEKQVAAWAREPQASLVATGIQLETEGGTYVRLPPKRVYFDDLLRSRITEIHPSSFLVRRSDLTGPVGLVDEELPAAYGEDYDLLLRAARLGFILSVVEPLVVVSWNRASFFAGKWEGIAAGLSYLLRKFPEFAKSRAGTARIASQVAFAHAALGESRTARRWALGAIRKDFRQLRAYAAFVVAARLAPPAVLVGLVNRMGRGL